MAGKATKGSRAATRIVVADDHPAVRNIVGALSRESGAFEVVGEADDGAKAIKECLRLKPDVLVLDLGLPRLSGFEVAKRLKMGPDGPKIVVFTASDDPHTVLDCLRIGVEGFVDKGADWGRLADAIKAVAAGLSAFDPIQERDAVAELARHAERSRRRSDAAAVLTPRELQVLALLAEGLSRRQMASRLHLSVRTIEAHVAKLYPKLDVHNRVQAVTRGFELGLLDTGTVPLPDAET